MQPAADLAPAAPSGGDRDCGVLARVVLPSDGRAVALYLDGAVPDTPTAAEVLDRRRVRVPAGSRVSFATWFAAFPAGWWARHTDVREVRLEVELSGCPASRSSSTGVKMGARTAAAAARAVRLLRVGRRLGAGRPPARRRAVGPFPLDPFPPPLEAWRK